MAKLYQLLQSIENRELKWVEKFLLSPYFNVKPTPIALFRYLLDFHPRYDQVDRKKLYGALRPGYGFDAKWLNDRYSELNRLLETFLQTQQLRRDEALGHMSRTKAFRERGLSRHFLKETQQSVQYFESIQAQSPLARLRLWELYHDLYRYPDKLTPADPRELQQKANDYLDQHYCLHQFAIVANLAGGIKANPYRLDQSWLTALIHHAASLTASYPLLQQYYQLVLLFEKECSLSDFEVAKESFLRTTTALDLREKAFLLMKLCNLGTSRISAGQLEFLPAVVSLYRHGIETELFLQEGILADGLFLNTCIFAAQAKEIDWALAFIRSYESKLLPRFKKETLALGHAYLAFHQGDFITAERRLRDVSSTDITYRIRIHSLSVRCLLEATISDDSFREVLRSKLKAFHRMIKGHTQLHPQRAQAYLNFAAATQAIAKFATSTKRTPSSHHELSTTVDSYAPLILKAWLKEKLIQVKPPLR